jgi:glycosyltransferase involved in cell wall biosynthesis
MDAYVVIATKGRPKEVGVLLDRLRHQTLQPKKIVVVGAGREDVTDAQFGELLNENRLQIVFAPVAGATRQRNLGLRLLRAAGAFPSDGASFVVFFDDDFRPHSDWLRHCALAFAAFTDVVGVTGRVLADGINGDPLTEAEAADFLSGQSSPRAHWASGEVIRSVSSAYGCNMAFIDRVARTCSFDEALPLYGWQEDRDFTGQSKAFGRTIYLPDCVGVHLGAKGARTKGVRLGYSQIANMIYLVGKGTVEPAVGLRFLLRALAANTVRSCLPEGSVDYRGRLAGNLRALGDLCIRRCRPERILDM